MYDHFRGVPITCGGSEHFSSGSTKVPKHNSKSVRAASAANVSGSLETTLSKLTRRSAIAHTPAVYRRVLNAGVGVQVSGFRKEPNDQIPRPVQEKCRQPHASSGRTTEPVAIITAGSLGMRSLIWPTRVTGTPAIELGKRVLGRAVKRSS